MSPKLSSLAVDDVEIEEVHGGVAMPDLYVVIPRHSKRNARSSAVAGSHEEVVYIGGRFTVSF